MRPPPPVPDNPAPAIPPGAALAHACGGGGVKLAVPGPAACRSKWAAPDEAAPDAPAAPEEGP
ncbi:hypothetical protein [Azonexus sp.]|uniref:hypothetical protein n=1 Tax=Azonexus sp. TaxID=1872668 RepID=UPI0035B3AF34